MLRGAPVRCIFIGARLCCAVHLPIPFLHQEQHCGRSRDLPGHCRHACHLVLAAGFMTHVVACPTVSEGQSNSSASFKPVLSMSYDNEGDASEGVQYQSTDGALPQAALAQLPALLCCLLGLQSCLQWCP